MNHNAYAVLICSRRRPEMLNKTINRIVNKFGVQPSRIICGISSDDYRSYVLKTNNSNDIHWIKVRKIGIGPAREAIRKESLKIFKKAKYFLWLDDKTTVHRGLWRGIDILKKKKAGIVCGVSSIIKFFMGDTAGKNEKLWGATLMLVNREVMKTCKFQDIRCYEDKAFMLEAIRRGWKIINDYGMEYSGPRHLKGGTSSHRGLDLKHVKYALRKIKKAVGPMVTKMTLKKKKDEGVWAISFKYSKEVLDSIKAYGI